MNVQAIPYLTRADALAIRKTAEEEIDKGSGKPILITPQAIMSLVRQAWEPNLGLATSRELLAEITARIEVGSTGLDYRTFDLDEAQGEAISHPTSGHLRRDLSP